VILNFIKKPYKWLLKPLYNKIDSVDENLTKLVKKRTNELQDKIIGALAQIDDLKNKLNDASYDALLNFIAHEGDNFENQISIAAITKNEAAYIQEWIEYHKIVGVEKFYIYDNESTDNTKEILMPYIESGEVVYSYIKTVKGQVKPQSEAYMDAVRKYKNKTRYLALIDIDEFIVPVTHNKIIDVINDIRAKSPFVSLGVHWVVYGYGGHYNKQNGLVIENYTKSDIVNKHIKSIVNPRTVIGIAHPHHANHFFDLSGIDENGNHVDDPPFWNTKVTQADIQQIRINHYWTKSYEEFSERLKRNKEGNPVADFYNFEQPPIEVKSESDAEKWTRFSHIDSVPDKEDMVMNRYIPLLKKALEDRKAVI
jgi:hypothetical protein